MYIELDYIGLLMVYSEVLWFFSLISDHLKTSSAYLRSFVNAKLLTSIDEEIIHITENVHFLAIEGTGTLTG